MDGKEVTQLVDKLAEKLGVAIERVQPVVVEALEQYALRNYVAGFINLGIFILMAFISLVGFKTLKKEDYDFESTDGGITVVCLSCGIIGSVVTLCNLTLHFARAVSPLPALLGF